MAENAEFLVKIESMLSNRLISEVLKELEDKENEHFVKNEAMELIAILCSKMAKLPADIANNKETYNSLEQYVSILVPVIDRGNPKEVFLALLEGLDSLQNHTQYSFIINFFYEPLKMTLQSIQVKKDRFIKMALSALYKSSVAQMDLKVEETHCHVISYLNFFKPFIEELKPEAQNTKILLNYILKLLYRPLLFTDLSEAKNPSLIEIIRQTLNLVGQIFKNTFLLFDFNFCLDLEESDDDNENCTNVSKEKEFKKNLALANLAYLLFSESSASTLRPYVFLHVFLFQKFLPFAIQLLSFENNNVIHKGLDFLNSILAPLSELEITYHYCSLNQAMELSNCLTNISMFCQTEMYRTQSNNVHATFVRKLDWPLRYDYLMTLVGSPNRTEVHSLAILYYKNFINISWNQPDEFQYFSGRNLHNFLKFALYLEDGPKTDILVDNLRIISAVNLLLFLALRDPKIRNVSGFWDVCHIVVSDFVEPLYKAIDLTRAHCELKKKENSSNTAVEELPTTVLIEDKPLPDVPNKFEKEGIEITINQLDLLRHRLSCFTDAVHRQSFT